MTGHVDTSQGCCMNDGWILQPEESVNTDIKSIYSSPDMRSVISEAQ